MTRPSPCLSLGFSSKLFFPCSSFAHDFSPSSCKPTQTFDRVSYSNPNLQRSMVSTLRPVTRAGVKGAQAPFCSEMHPFSLYFADHLPMKITFPPATPIVNSVERGWGDNPDWFAWGSVTWLLTSCQLRWPNQFQDKAKHARLAIQKNVERGYSAEWKILCK